MVGILPFQDEIEGLEVDRFYDGNFTVATPNPGTCVINMTDLLQKLSNWDAVGLDGYLPSCKSTAFFVHPSRYVFITLIVEKGESGPDYEPVMAGCWSDASTAQNYRHFVPKETADKVQAAKRVGLRYMMVANISKKPRVI